MEFSTRFFPFQMQEIKVVKIAEIAEISKIQETAKIMWKQRGKFHFRIRKSSTKFHIKVREPHFKLRKALFKKGQKETVKTYISQNLTQKKAVGFFLLKKNCLKKIILLRLLYGIYFHQNYMIGSQGFGSNIFLKKSLFYSTVLTIFQIPVIRRVVNNFLGESEPKGSAFTG